MTSPKVTRPIQQGRRWAFLVREDIPDQADPARVYLRRWRLLQTPWFGIYLHAIYAPDADRHMHDHPWSFVSVLLRGGYAEQRPHRGIQLRRAGSIAFRTAEVFHRIVTLSRTPTWTLVLTGRRRRAWGFLTPHGWVRAEHYFRGGALSSASHPKEEKHGTSS